MSRVERLARFLGWKDEKRGAAVLKVWGLVVAIAGVLSGAAAWIKSIAEEAASTTVTRNSTKLESAYVAAMNATVVGFTSSVAGKIAEVQLQVSTSHNAAKTAEAESKTAIDNSAAARTASEGARIAAGDAVQRSSEANDAAGLARTNAQSAKEAAEEAIRAANTIKNRVADVDARKIIEAITRIEEAEKRLRELKHPVPVGTIAAYACLSDNIPPGWLICDGKIRLNSEYYALSIALGKTWGEAPEGSFKLPDLRGMFLRGASAGRAVGTAEDDAARISGSVLMQLGTISGTGFQPKIMQGLEGNEYGGAKCRFSPIPSDIGAKYVLLPSETAYATLTPGPGSPEETRPKNVAVNWIIKY